MTFIATHHTVIFFYLVEKLRLGYFYAHYNYALYDIAAHHTVIFSRREASICVIS